MRRHARNQAVCCSILLALSGGALQAQSSAAPSVAASLPDFTGIVAQNAPAVVHVEAHYRGNWRPTGAPAGPDSQELAILRQLFGIGAPQQPPHTSLGSGFIISADGYLLTNNHVVQGADQVTVRLQDHRRLVARVVGTDSSYDIALLKVSAPAPLPAVQIGDSRALKPGQWVLAIGSPFGFDYTVTQGIVSAVGRSLGTDQPATSFIQTDVPINRGNSGGPLFNLQGQVVGINSQIYSNTGGYQGVAFAIPIDVAMHAVAQLKAKGYVSRGMLGVALRPVDAEVVKALGLPNVNGALIAAVQPGSGAAKAGVQPGDVIQAFDGHTIYVLSDLPPLVSALNAGTQVQLQVWRKGRQLKLPVTIGEMPVAGQPQAATQPAAAATNPAIDALGLAVRDIDASHRRSLQLAGPGGVQISAVDGIAAQQGVQPGDVILRFNQQPIPSAAAFDAAVARLKAGDTVLLLIQRDQQVQFVALSVATMSQEALP